MNTGLTRAYCPLGRGNNTADFFSSLELNEERNRRVQDPRLI